MSEISPPPILHYSESMTIRHLVEEIDKKASQAVVILNENNTVFGMATDGDIRRALLAGLSLQDLCESLINTKPKLARIEKNEVAKFAKTHRVSQVIRVDEQNKFLSFHLESFYPTNLAPALILAGGKGTRLYPITAEKPKPLLHVGGMPIIERIIRDLHLAGVREFHFSLNYLSDQVLEFLDNLQLDKFDYSYSIETEELGTAGPILESGDFLTKNETIFVINGDLMATPDYEGMQTHHMLSESSITVLSVEAKTQIQFGVLEHKNSEILAINEKPEIRFDVAAGVYLLDTQKTQFGPSSGRLDMPDLINDQITVGNRVSRFTHRGQWIDIGRPAELEEARRIFEVSDSLNDRNVGI
jgi:dTDP-glucose pyrophosphorylase